MLETIYNTQTTTESAYLLTAYERLGNIDLEAYAINEVIRPYLESLSDSDLIYAYNEFCDYTGYEPFYTNDEDFFSILSPMEAVKLTYYGDYRFMDDLVQVNTLGNFDSYDYYKARKLCLEEEEFLSWIYENHYFDDEEEEREDEALNLVRMGY